MSAAGLDLSMSNEMGSWQGQGGPSLYLSFILTSTEAGLKHLYSNWKYAYE